jgi:beta-lactam-binding protein with PASTA domain
MDVEGMPAQVAKAALERQRLADQLNLAEAAPTSAEAFVVKTQTPGAGTRLQEQDVVTLDVYGAHAPPVAIPQVLGLPGSVAQRRLTDLGLDVRLRSIGTAPSVMEAFRVFDVAPGEGTTVPAGATVSVSAHGPYQDRVAMPGVVGMDYREAARILRSLGLAPALEGGRDVHDPEQEERVYAQDPAPGATIGPSHPVRLSYHGRYVFHGRMPDVRGLGQRDALERIAHLPLQVLVEPGDPAPTPGQSGTVAAQSIPAGQDLAAGDGLVLTVFAASVAEQLAAAGCAALPGSVAAWDGTGRRAVCRCQEGLKPAADGRSCRLPQSVAVAPPGAAPPAGWAWSGETRPPDDPARRLALEEEARRRREQEERARRRAADDAIRRQAWEEERRRQEAWEECRRLLHGAALAAERGQFDESYRTLDHANAVGCPPGEVGMIAARIQYRQALIDQQRLLRPPPPVRGETVEEALRSLRRWSVSAPGTTGPGPVAPPRGGVLPGFGDGGRPTGPAPGRPPADGPGPGVARPPPARPPGSWVPPLNQPSGGGCALYDSTLCKMYGVPIRR